jgi:hypothetical protein
MDQDVVLPRPVAEDRQARRHPMSDQASQQRPLAGDPHVPRLGDPQLPQSGLPGDPVHEHVPTPAESVHHRLGELLPPPVSHRGLIDHVVGVRPPEDLQEVEPALAVGAGEGGEPFVADLGAGPIVPPVPRPGVVHLDVGRDRQGRRQEFGLLLVEGVLPLGEDAAELAGGDVDAQLAQLLQEQRLGHVLMVVLVEDETDQVGSEVAAGQDVGGERSHHTLPTGGQPAFAAIADDAWLEDQLLNDEVLVAFEAGAQRDVGQGDDDLFGDGQLGGLGAFGGARPFGLGVARRSRRRLEGAGNDPGSGLEALEAGDLVLELLSPLFESLDSILLEGDDLQELEDQRRAFGLRDVGHQKTHNLILPTAQPVCPR